MPENWRYTLTFRFTPAISGIITGSSLFELSTNRQLTVGEKSSIEAGAFQIIDEKQTE